MHVVFFLGLLALLFILLVYSEIRRFFVRARRPLRAIDDQRAENLSMMKNAPLTAHSPARNPVCRIS